MKRKSLISLVFTLGLVWSMLLTAPATLSAATRYTASPAKCYLSTAGVQDKLFPDYIVEFEIPLNATNWMAYTTTSNWVENAVLAFSTIAPAGERNGKKVIRVTTGIRARRCSGSYDPRSWNCWYTASVSTWSSKLRLRYYT